MSLSEDEKKGIIAQRHDFTVFIKMASLGKWQLSLGESIGSQTR
jgi:hypothetical protein